MPPWVTIMPTLPKTNTTKVSSPGHSWNIEINKNNFRVLSNWEKLDGESYSASRYQREHVFGKYNEIDSETYNDFIKLINELYDTSLNCHNNQNNIKKVEELNIKLFGTTKYYNYEEYKYSNPFVAPFLKERSVIEIKPTVTAIPTAE